jgi:hypothetical protein
MAATTRRRIDHQQDDDDLASRPCVTKKNYKKNNGCGCSKKRSNNYNDERGRELLHRTATKQSPRTLKKIVTLILTVITVKK